MQGSIPCCLITGVFGVVGSYGANTKEVWRRGQHKSYSETIGDNYQVRCGGIGKATVRLIISAETNLTELAKIPSG
nr:MAG TPA: hypothetical protein [Caudoviricetes sp.]